MNKVADHARQGELIAEYIGRQNKTEYMLTIARDGELPERSVYFFGSALDAVDAYGRYENFGFSKNYLLVKLYEPNGLVHEKILRRPPAGECSFVKENYIRVVELLLEVKPLIDINLYNKIVNGLALIFSQDNIRFDYPRFIVQTDSVEVIE